MKPNDTTKTLAALDVLTDVFAPECRAVGPPMDGEVLEQAIACMTCAAGELVRSDSERMTGHEWPPWRPGLQAFPCPQCGGVTCWATEPRESLPSA